MTHKWPQSLKLNFPNYRFWIFVGSSLEEYLILHILVFHFILTYCKLPYQIKKKGKIMTSFRTPTSFSYLNEKLYFCSHIAESENIAENAQYRQNFLRYPFITFWIECVATTHFNMGF